MATTNETTTTNLNLNTTVERMAGLVFPVTMEDEPVHLPENGFHCDDPECPCWETEDDAPLLGMPDNGWPRKLSSEDVDPLPFAF